MTVNPGFGGQSFIPAMVDKIRETRNLVQGRDIDIEVDGGITAETAPLVVKAGANALVAGSAVYKGDAKAYGRNIAAIRTSATSLAA
jgi:ribulose-phosphate 3-epimerase